MKFLTFIFILTFFYIPSYAEEKKMYIGIAYDKVFTNRKEGRIGARIWNKYMLDRGFENVFVKFYEDENTLLADYLTNRISSLVSTYEMYYNNRKSLEDVSKRRWIPTVTDNIFEQYYLIKNKDSLITLDNLKNRVIYYKKTIGKIWVDDLVLKKYQKPISKVFKKVVEIKKPQKLIFNVFFNKNEISIVSKKVYDDMLELNPQIKNKIEIIKKSEAIFLSGIGFSSKNFDSYYDKMITDVQEDIDERGEIKLSDAIYIHKIHYVKNAELKPLDGFFNNYLKLKKIHK